MNCDQPRTPANRYIRASSQAFALVSFCNDFLFFSFSLFFFYCFPATVVLFSFYNGLSNSGCCYCCTKFFFFLKKKIFPILLLGEKKKETFIYYGDLTGTDWEVRIMGGREEKFPAAGIRDRDGEDLGLQGWGVMRHSSPLPPRRAGDVPVQP